jgi:polar amino acid transport system substrate-binding protein
MKKILALALAAIMCFSMVALSSCGGKGYDFDNETELVMVTNAAFPPYEYTDPEGPFNGYAGIDVEIAMEIAKRLGKTLKIKDVEFDSIIGGINSGKYDMALAGLTVTEERKKSVSFTDSYAKGVQVMIVAEGSAYTSIDDFFNYDENGDPVSLKNTDVKIGVQKTTTGDIYASSDVTGWGFNDVDDKGVTKKDRVVRYKTGAEAVAALKAGKVDCVIIDNEPAKSFVAANEGIHILEGDNEYAIEDYAICVAKGNKELLEQINKALKELKEDGTIDKIVNKYINGGN